MAKQETRLEINSFVKGLVTEASPLTFPPNASMDEANFVLNRDGSRNRRLGFDKDRNSRLVPFPSVGYSRGVVSNFVWKNAGGLSGKDFLVVAVANYINFFDLNTQAFVGSVTSIYGNTAPSMASVGGNLVVTYGTTDFTIVEYNTVTQVFTQTLSTWRVRDFWGVETSGVEETDPGYRPTTLTKKHEYNLQNQSWGVTRKDKVNTIIDPIAQFKTDLANYPSNSEKVWTGLQYQPVVSGADPYERMFSNLYDDRKNAAGYVSKGYYIIDFMSRGRSRVVATNQNKYKYGIMNALVFEDVPSDQSYGGATCVVEYAGRVFFAGFFGVTENPDKRSPLINNYVLFSQLVKNKLDIPKCYQEGDPTSRENSDVVDTDGGYIRISGAEKIVSMCTIGNSLVVLASNGVWAISGGNNYGFSATNYKVDKLSSFGCIAHRSVVNNGASVLFVGTEGIYSVAFTKTNDLAVQDITQGVIQTFYSSIPLYKKQSSIAEADYIENKVRFLFSDGAINGTEYVTTEIVLDTILGSFYVNRIYNILSNPQEINGMFRVNPFLSNNKYSSLKYIVINLESTGVRIGFGSYKNTNFKDYYSVDSVGIDAKAYLITGALTASDSAIAKNTPYLTMHFVRTESGVDSNLVPLKQSSCYGRVQWDWSDSPLSKKWGKTMQLYRQRIPLFTTDVFDTFDNGFETVVSKSKIRGSGKALSLYFETEPEKDCHILGWNLTIQGNAIT